MAETITAARAAAEAIVQAARSGNSLRASAAGIAWQPIAPYSIAAHCAQTATTERSFSVSTVSPTQTPVAVVAEGQPKPAAATSALSDVQLVKYAGTASVSLESLLWADEVERLVGVQLLRQAIAALDVDLVDAFTDDGIVVNPGASTGAAAILAASAELIAVGGVPSAVALAPSDYASVIGENDGGSWLNMTSGEDGNRGTLFGLSIVVSAAVAAGSAFVFDREGVVVCQHAESPLVFISPMSTSNVCTITLDVLAAPAVVNGSAVASVSLDGES